MKFQLAKTAAITATMCFALMVPHAPGLLQAHAQSDETQEVVFVPPVFGALPFLVEQAAAMVVRGQSILQSGDRQR